MKDAIYAAVPNILPAPLPHSDLPRAVSNPADQSFLGPGTSGHVVEPKNVKLPFQSRRVLAWDSKKTHQGLGTGGMVSLTDDAVANVIRPSATKLSSLFFSSSSF